MKMRKFIIYGKGGCPSCIQARQLIAQKGFGFQYKQLGKDYTLKEFTELTSQRTFPYIVEVTQDFPDNAVEGEKYAIITKKIGTFTDLQTLLEIV